MLIGDCLLSGVYWLLLRTLAFFCLRTQALVFCFSPSSALVFYVPRWLVSIFVSQMYRLLRVLFEMRPPMTNNNKEVT